MGLTSEQVHWIGGAFFTVVAVLLILYETKVWPARWLAFVLPVALLGYGAESLIDPLIHGAAAPKNYGAETAQHIIQGILVLAAGAVELLRAKGKLQRVAWGFLLPVVLLGWGGIFLFHAQHEAGVPQLVLIVQHRIFGVTLWIAAMARALAELRAEKTRAFAVGWLVPILLFGLELLLYTEGGSPAGHAGH